VIAGGGYSLASTALRDYKGIKAFEKRPSEMVAVLFLELPSKNKEAAVGDPRRLFLWLLAGGCHWSVRRASHNAPMRVRNAFGLSANKLAASLVAALR